ncbi:MAG: hypothetical protein QOE33_170 [Acidobacteriota bacterium]|nr:hypothetical protein [Acidobacteriota bacterium]
MKRRRRAAIKISSLILLPCFSIMLAWAAAQALIVRVPAVERADAIAVLSGSEVYRERAEFAAELFKAGRAPRVVLTNDTEPGGWSQERGRTMLFVERAQETLTRAGVPPQSIEVAPGSVSSTYDEAATLAAYARARSWRSIVVVTSGYHSRRAWWTLQRAFEGSGIVVSLEPATVAQSPSPWTWWESAAGWRMVAGEYVKLIYYHLHYRKS